MTIEVWETWTNCLVGKDSHKPFKSGSKFNTVKGIVDHPILHIPAFVFFEDDSIVECRQCKLQEEKK